MLHKNRHGVNVVLRAAVDQCCSSAVRPFSLVQLTIILVPLLASPVLLARPQSETAARAHQQDWNDTNRRSTYVLGPDDQIVIRALHADEISDKPYRIQPDGNINLAMIGEVIAGGLTVGELEARLASRLKQYYVDPQVTVTITDFRSQPVSVVGAVTSPGVVQLQGRKTLLEILSMAGGPRPDAGPVVRVTRDLQWGRVPLPNAYDDASGQSNIAEVNLRELVDSRDSRENILISPRDVISVPPGGVVYVIGEVKKSGGFVLGARPTISVLEALSLAEGLQPRAAPGKAHILRAIGGNKNNRREEPVNLAKMMSGNAPEVFLGPADILFVPNSAAKNVTLRTIETAIQIGTGLAIWRIP